MLAKSAGWGTAISSCLSLPMLSWGGARATRWTPTTGQASFLLLPAAWIPPALLQVLPMGARRRGCSWVPHAPIIPGAEFVQLERAFLATSAASPPPPPCWRPWVGCPGCVHVDSGYRLRPPLCETLGPAEGTQDPFSPYPVFVKN